MAEDIYNASEMISMLTDANNKRTSGNIYKLFKAIEKPLRDIYITTNIITQFRGIDEATGATLDLIGMNYNVSRAGMYDDMYRSYIKGAVARIWCDGTYNSVLKMLALTLNTDVKNISLIEDYVNSSGSATVTIDEVPKKELNAIGMTIEQYSSIVQSILPTGISLTLRSYEGSFSFANENPEGDTYNPEMDANTGFANDEQTTGGTLAGVIQSS